MPEDQEDKIGNYSESTKSVMSDNGQDTDIGFINRENMKSKIEKEFITDSAIETVNEAGAEVPDEDPELLKSYAKQTVASTVISTISKDASAADYTTDVDLNSLFRRDKNFRYAIDELVTSILETGVGYFGLERDLTSGNNIDEIVVLDPSTMFVNVDESGRIQHYVHKPKSIGSAHIVDTDNVVMFGWGSRYDGIYPKAPISDIMPTLERLQEIEEKELTQLREGSPRGVLAMTEDHDTIPLGADEWETARNIWEQSKGELHKDLFLRGKWDYVRTSMGIDELDLGSLYQRYVKEVCSAFHITPNYAGYNFSEGGIGLGNAREQDRKIYAQKGLRMVLKHILEDKIEDIVQEIEEDATFKFKIPERDANTYYNELAKASIKLQEAGVEHVINEDDNIVLEDETEIRPEQVEDVLEDDDKQEKVVTKEDTEELDKLGYKQIEFSENYGKPFTDAILEVVNDYDKTKDRIKTINSNVSSDMSNTTYYNWLEQLGIKSKV